MRKSIVVVDDFYADLHAVRKYALGCEWYAPYRDGNPRPSWQSTRYRAAADCPFKSSSRLIETLERLTGDTIDLEDWKSTFPTGPDGSAYIAGGTRSAGTLWNCSFHFKPSWNRQKLGEGVHNHVTDHWNGVGNDGWAGLIYLDPRAPLDGGLKLWRNIDPSRNLDWMTPPENWELIDDLGNVANRLILHRGNLPHSGTAGWGETADEGRLYQTFFFKVRPVTHPASMDLELAGRS
jgi:hypothetical protein